MPLKVAIVPGHSASAGGAVSVSGVNEFVWNSELVQDVAEELRALGVEVVQFVRPNGPYTRALKILTTAVNDAAPTLAISFHFDGSENPKRHGTSCLYWPGSVAGESLAAKLSAHTAMTLGLRNRGPQPRTVSHDGLPLYWLRSLKCPSVILESHFGSNAFDHEAATNSRDSGELAREIAKAVVIWYQDWTDADG